MERICYIVRNRKDYDDLSRILRDKHCQVPSAFRDPMTAYVQDDAGSGSFAYGVYEDLDELIESVNNFASPDRVEYIEASNYLHVKMVQFDNDSLMNFL